MSPSRPGVPEDIRATNAALNVSFAAPSPSGRTLDRLEQLAQSTVVQSVLATATTMLSLFLPPAGVLLAGTSATLQNALANHAAGQVDALINDTRVRLTALDDRIDEVRLCSSEWNTLAVQVVLEAAQTRAEKIPSLAALLAGYVSKDIEIAEPDVESLLSSIAHLPASVIEYGRLIFEADRHNESDVDYGVVPPPGGSDQTFYLTRLEGAGLIVSRAMYDESPISRGSVDVTPTARRLFRLLRAGTVQMAGPAD